MPWLTYLTWRYSFIDSKLRSLCFSWDHPKLATMKIACFQSFWVTPVMMENGVNTVVNSNLLYIYSNNSVEWAYIDLLNYGISSKSNAYMNDIHELVNIDGKSIIPVGFFFMVLPVPNVMSWQWGWTNPH